jgi:glycosyltransferase involved in cell wall biosynthesis
VGGRIILLDGSLQEAGSIVWRDGSCLGYGRGDNPFSSTYMFRRDVDYCSGAFLLTPRRVWKALGGFDETFKPAYYEETDYCMRLWERNLRVVYDPYAAVLHHEFASSSSTADAIALQARHRHVFAARHAQRLQQHLDAATDAVLAARTHRAMPQRPRVLFIDDQAPHRTLGSGVPRARTILLSLVKRRIFVTLFPMVVVDEEWASVYSDLPRDIEVINDAGLALLEAFLRNRRGYYDAIVVSRAHNMKILAPILEAHPDWREEVSIIYDAEAFLAPREIGRMEILGTPSPANEAGRIHKQEAALAACADCVVAVSEADRALFHEYGIRHVHVLGHSLEAKEPKLSFEQRHGFLFVGSIHEDTSPNGDSMVWFLSEIWPSIRERLGGTATLTIAGLHKSERLKAMAGPGIQVTGPVDDLSGYYESARVFIAPTRFAAGIPHKVHESASRGVPAVVTPLLAGQLGWRHGAEVLTGGNAAEFAARCIQLHEERDTWLRVRQAALAAVSRDCSEDVFQERISEILSCARLDPGDGFKLAGALSAGDARG